MLRLSDVLEVVRSEIASIQNQFESLICDHKILLDVLERAGCLRFQKRSRTDDTEGDDQHRTLELFASYEAT